MIPEKLQTLMLGKGLQPEAKILFKQLLPGVFKGTGARVLIVQGVPAYSVCQQKGGVFPYTAAEPAPAAINPVQHVLHK